MVFSREICTSLCSLYPLCALCEPSVFSVNHSKMEEIMAFDREACARFYQENGYYIYENALTAAEVEALRRDATQICRGETAEIRGLLPVDAETSEAEI